MSLSDEFIRCASDFDYFCRTYCFVKNIDGNLVSFRLRDYQERLYHHIESNTNTIFSKFHIGGFSTELVVYCLWKCLFVENFRILFFPKNSVQIFDFIVSGLPSWLRGRIKKNNTHRIFTDSKSEIHFLSTLGVVGQKYNLLVMDEVSKIANIDLIYDNFSYNVCGKKIICSQVDYEDDWFYKALNSLEFSIYECYWYEFYDSRISGIDDDNWELNFLQIPRRKKLIIEEAKKGFRNLYDDWQISRIGD
jgi:hypothetical protein